MCIGRRGAQRGPAPRSARSMATRWATISTASATRLESRRLREHAKPAIGNYIPECPNPLRLSCDGYYILNIR